MIKVNGIITAMVTPLNTNESVDIQKTEKLINYLLRNKVDGLFILGTNGEAHALSNKEKVLFAKKVVEITNKRVPIYAGVGGNSTNETIIMAKKIEAVGVDALSIITPYFIPITQEELYEHYAMIASSTSLPIILYNMPSNTGINIEVDTLKKLSEIDNIIGIKDSSGDLENTKKYIDVTSNQSDFYVLSGSDSKILDILIEGGDGAVTAVSNVLTETIVNIYKFWKNNDVVKAREYQNLIEPIRAVLKKGTIPSVLKASLNEMGIPVGLACKPTKMPKEDVLKDLRMTLETYKQQNLI